jgi:glycosyltransferase involved in cell wall biosynthesis
MQFTKLIIIDNSLKNTAGHHYEYARAVGDEARRRGMEVVVAAHRNAEQGVKETINALPVFRRGLYDKGLNPARFPAIVKTINGIIYNYEFLRDWRKAKLRDTTDSGTIVFIPNCIEIMVVAIFLLLSFQPASRRPRMVCFFRRDPRKLMPLIGALLRRFERNGSVMMVTDSDVLADQYGRQTRMKFYILPIPHLPVFPAGKSRAEMTAAPVRITYLGDARMEKGIDILAGALPLLDAELKEKKLTCTIQCHSVTGEPGIEPALRLLASAESANPETVRLVRKPLTTEEYYALISATDAVVVPYRMEEYRARTSGILAEAISAGKPVIVTDHTWMSGQVGKYGSGILFQDGNCADLARAIRQLIRERDPLTTLAESKVAGWQNLHTARRLVDILIASPEERSS